MKLIRIAIAALLIGGCDSASQPETTEESGHAFVNVSVVAMQTEGVAEGQTVLVVDGQITGIGPFAEIEVPNGFEVIDGAGRYLAPGLADMHAHPMTQTDLDLYTANGVTLIRSMWSEAPLLELRDGVESGEIVGPRILAGGRIVDGAPVIHYGSDLVLTPEDALRVVSAHKAAGYDFIKVYSNLSQEAFDAIAAAAKAHDIPFAGHIPNAVATQHAFEAGMQTAEHLIGIGKASAADGEQHLWRFAPEFVEFARRLGAGEASVDGLYDANKLAALAESAAATGIWTVPTLVTIRGTAMSPDGAVAEMQRPAWEYLDYTVRTFWQMGSMARTAWTEETYRGSNLLFNQEKAQVKAFHDAGARILMGTDAPNPWAFVGFGVVDELQLYVDAGLTPFEAIATATTAPAEFMGEAGTSGIVAAGARADLVLLEGNPLEDIRAFSNIAGVMTNGNWLDRAALDARLAGIKAASDWKEQHFADAPGWATNEGEAVLFSAEFVLMQNDAVIGADRISSIFGPDGVTATLGQVKSSVGEYENVRIDMDPSAPPQLTGSAVDWLTLGQSIATMQDGETRTIDAVIRGGDGVLTDASVTATRHPVEVLVGHFYWTGANRHDIEISAGGETRRMQVWMGGGFYTGWPIRIVVEDAAGDIEYRRIL